jgi:hypothetical protein
LFEAPSFSGAIAANIPFASPRRAAATVLAHLQSRRATMNEFVVTTGVTGRPAIFGNHQAPEFVVVWLDALGINIKGARFDGSGNKIDNADFAVSPLGGTSLGFPVIAGAGGFLSPGFVVAWIAAGSVFVQRFGSDGKMSGGAVKVNTTQVPSEETAPALTGLPDGSFVISWGAGVQGIRAQIFSGDGVKSGPEIGVNTSAGPHFFPAIATLGGDGFVIAWSARPSAPDGSRRFQIFDSSGKKQGGEQTPRHGIGLGQGSLSMVASSGKTKPNDFVNVMLSAAGTGGQEDGVMIVVATLYDTDGDLPITDNVTHKDDLTVSSDPVLTALPNAQLVAAWSERKVATTGQFGVDIKAAILEVQPAGAQDVLVSAPEVQINATLPPTDPKKDRSVPCVAAIGQDGASVVVAWCEQNLAPPFLPTPVLKARIVSNQLR